MNLSDRDIVLMYLFIHDLTKSHTFCFQAKEEYKQQVLDLEKRLIAEREKRWTKGLREYEKELKT